MGWNPFKKKHSDLPAGFGQEFSIYPTVAGEDVQSMVGDSSTWLGQGPASAQPAPSEGYISPRYAAAMSPVQSTPASAPVSIPVISIDENGLINTQPAENKDTLPANTGITLPGISSHDVHVSGMFGALDPTTGVNKLQNK